mmetsp:Transcript_49136/g.110488  ORF Transcript_49136/g.110488 Transcript_49136/m.110488 type:complete len:322 (+) Transcript_49136:937-1902(+)
MVGHQPLAVRERSAGSLDHSDSKTIDSVVNLLVTNLLLVIACGNDGGFVHQVSQRRARKPGGSLSHHLQVELVRQGLAPAMHLEDLHPAVHVREINGNTAIKTAGTQQGGVEHVRAVGSSKHDHPRVPLETIHLGQDLVERLLTLVVPTAHAAAAASALAPHSINLINKNDTWSILFRLCEEVAHARRADTDKHLDKLGPRRGDKRDAGLSCHRACEKGLPGAWRPLHDGTTGDLRAEGRVLPWVLQELNDFSELQLRRVATGDIRKRDTRIGLHLQFGLRFPHAHRPTHTTHRSAATTLPALATLEKNEPPDDEEWESEA